MDKSFDTLRCIHHTTSAESAWLNQRLDEITVKEAVLLHGAIAANPPCCGREAVELLAHLPEYELCYPANDPRQLGEFLAREEYAMDDVLLTYLDLDKLASRYMEEHPGQFTGGAYVYHGSGNDGRHYDGTNLAQLEDKDWSVKLRLASDQNPEGVWLKLPDYEEINDGRPDEIRIALDVLGVRTIEECQLLDAKCILPEIRNIAGNYDSLAELIYDGQNLGFALDERGQGMPHFMEKFAAALEYERCRTLADAVDITQNLSCYDFIPEEGFHDYAMRELQRRGYFRGESSLADCFDFEVYAANLLEKQGFLLTKDEKSYITRKDTPFVPVHDHPKSQQMVMQ
ncbi:MAG: hypothetical protein VB064_09015 [Oscillospiraceae bacterium]|nr:hypothetical protein [Oscillospiraceae bacterium]